MYYQGVILSGTPGSGKSTLLRAIAERQTWPIFSIGDFWKERWRAAHPQADIDFATYWKNTSYKENLRVNLEARKIYEKGNIVSDSRYSAAYCQDLPLLLVFVNASIEVRARRAIGNVLYQGKNNLAIIETLVQREIDEVTRGKELFGRDYDFRDEGWYDAILNTSRMTIGDELAHLIKSLQENPRQRLRENIFLNKQAETRNRETKV